MYRQRNDNHAFNLLVNGAIPPDPSLVLPGSEGFAGSVQSRVYPSFEDDFVLVHLVVVSISKC
jgi:hypothetical protein